MLYIVYLISLVGEEFAAESEDSQSYCTNVFKAIIDLSTLIQVAVPMSSKDLRYVSRFQLLERS